LIFFAVVVSEFDPKIYILQLVDNHIVNGRVSTAELDNDLVGESLSNTKLRSNVYITEDQDWKEVKVSPLRLTRPGADAIKKFTPSLGISYLGVTTTRVRSKIWEPLVTLKVWAPKFLGNVSLDL